MTSKLQPLQLDSFSGGMMSNVALHLLPPNVASQSINFHYDVVGQATQRNGTTSLGTTGGSGACTGIFQFINSAGTKNVLLASFGQGVFAYNGSAWSNLGNVLSASAQHRFASFLNFVFLVGNNEIFSWNGTIGTPFGNTYLTGAPGGKNIVTYKERVYVAGNRDFPDRLFFSSIASTAGLITWDQNVQYLDINPEDGNNITALAKLSNLLLIFKERAMYRWNGTSTDAEIIVDIGTTSQESVAQCKGRMFFFNPDGIFSTDGGYPQEISRPVYDWIKNMSPANYSSVSGYCDQDHYYCNIGNVTKDGRTYTNVWIVYTISSQVLAVYSLGANFKAMTKYVTTSGAVTYVGGETALVHTLMSGNTDNGTPITWEWESKELEFDSRGTNKSISKIAAYMASGGGGVLQMRRDDGSFYTVGECSKDINIFKTENFNFNVTRLKMSGTNTATPIALHGIEVIDGVSKGFVQ